MVIVAGCGMPAGSQATESSTPSTSDATSSSTATETADTATGSETASCEPSTPTAAFELFVEADLPLRVTVVDATSDTVVWNATYPERTTYVAFGEESGVFEPGTPYRVVVSVNETVRWNHTVHRTERYEVVVHENGSVEVRSIAVVHTATPC